VRDKDDDEKRSTHEQKIKVIIERWVVLALCFPFFFREALSRNSPPIFLRCGRFGKGKGAEGLEAALLEATPVTKHKLQPSASHSVTLRVEEAGLFVVWGFTTLPGKSNPAKDVGTRV
jgi:hypothetical protein